jgi:ribosomal protein L13E
MTAVTIYGLCDPRTGIVRYVGKATDAEKRYRAHMREHRRRTPLYDWIAKLRRNGEAPTLAVLLTCEEADWRYEEQRLIAWSRALGPPLLNLAHGGDEPLCSPQVRAENGRRTAAKRPAYVMRVYRQIESDIRWARRELPEKVAAWEANLRRFSETVEECRHLGVLDDLNRRLGLLLDGRREEAMALPSPTTTEAHERTPGQAPHGATDPLHA